jgi:hypothetical protein
LYHRPYCKSIKQKEEMIMKKRQTHLAFFSIMILALMFVGMQAFVPVDALAQEEGDGSFEPESAGPHSFYPVTPCRIAESRPWFAPWATSHYQGPFSVGTTRCYSNYSATSTPGDTQDQGGNLAGCPGTKPANDAGAFHVVVTAVPVHGAGHVRIYPANVARPRASILSWSANAGNVSNAVSADSYESTAVDEFCIYIGGFPGGSTHIIMDVMGYFD